MSQNHQIHTHLKRGSLTAMSALRLYGVMRLAARIQDLRDRGVSIRTTTIHSGKKKFAQYTLAK